MNDLIYTKEHAEFVTITCLEWQHVLMENRFKDIIIESLRFLAKEKRVSIYGFVIMSNHFHLIWQMMGDNKRDDVQRDFLKFTGQQILKHLRNEQSSLSFAAESPEGNEQSRDSPRNMKHGLVE